MTVKELYEEIGKYIDNHATSPIEVDFYHQDEAQDKSWDGSRGKISDVSCYMYGGGGFVVILEIEEVQLYGQSKTKRSENDQR